VQIFRNLFKDGLAIQRERIQDVRRYAKEQREKQEERRQNEIDSLEN
jgi:centrosomal protein CEP95